MQRGTYCTSIPAGSEAQARRDPLVSEPAGRWLLLRTFCATLFGPRWRRAASAGWTLSRFLPGTSREHKILGLDLHAFAASFVEVSNTPFLVIRAEAAESKKWAKALGVAARRCYISDDALRARAEAGKVSGSQVAAAKIPDPGSVMSGDFGELITAFYFAARSLPSIAIDPIRWRYKADRKKAAPFSDVVQLILPSWPVATADDRIVCAEVKAKATAGAFDPIGKAGMGSAADRGGRLVNTLAWLKDKALTDGSDTLEIAQLERFLHAVDHPRASWEFCAVAVIDSDFVEDEIAKGTAPDPHECTLIVISVSELKSRYTELFAEIVASANQLAPGSAASGSPTPALAATSDAGAGSTEGTGTPGGPS